LNVSLLNVSTGFWLENGLIEILGLVQFISCNTRFR